MASESGLWRGGPTDRRLDRPTNSGAGGPATVQPARRLGPNAALPQCRPLQRRIRRTCASARWQPTTRAATPSAATAAAHSATHPATHLARTFHQVAPVHPRSASESRGGRLHLAQATLDGRGTAGLRGARAGPSRSSVHRCLRASAAPLAQSGSRGHPRKSRVPDETSGPATHGDLTLAFRVREGPLCFGGLHPLRRPTSCLPMIRCPRWPD